MSALAWQLGGIVLVVIAPLNYDLPNELMKVTCDKAVTLLKCFGTSRVAPRLCAQRHPSRLCLYVRAFSLVYACAHAHVHLRTPRRVCMCACTQTHTQAWMCLA